MGDLSRVKVGKKGRGTSGGIGLNGSRLKGCRRVREVEGVRSH